MIKSVIFLSCLVLTIAFPMEDYKLEILEDQEGHQYYLVPIEDQPLQRQRRQTSGGIGSSGIDISHKGTLVNNDNHKLDGTVFGQRAHDGLLSGGGKLDYLHKPSQSTASITSQTYRGLGTSVGAEAGYNFFKSRDGRTTGSATGQYERHFGGPGGTGRPNYGAFLNFNHRF